MSLIVTGTLGIDTVYTPTGEHRENVLGGSCAYFAAAAQHHAQVRIVGVVGDDFPEEFRASLQSMDNIGLDGLETRKGSKTFRWGGKYLDNMDSRETLYTELNVLIEAPPSVPSQYRDSKLVFLANSHPAVQLGLLEQIDKPALAVADTMDLWIDTARPELDALMRKVDGLVLNYDEAQQLTGMTNTIAAAHKITAMGPKFVVVKKGEHGCVFVCGDRVGALPAYPSNTVVDPTGAGDSFAGGMMGYLAGRADKGKAADVLADFSVFRSALAHGTVMASYVIETFSLERLINVTSDERNARFNQFREMVVF